MTLKTEYAKTIKEREKDIALNPCDAEAFSALGEALFELAKLTDDEKLYYESVDRYKKAVELAPNDYYIIHDLGLALQTLAKLKNDKKLYCESAEKYKASVKQGGNYVAFAFNNWGNALYDLAKLSQDNDFNKCLKEYVAAHSAIKDAPSYNLACVFALIGDKTNALLYLDKSLKKNGMFIKNVLKDKDWQTYLDDAEFQALLNRYRGGARLWR